MANGNLEHVALRTLGGERSFSGFNAQEDLFADVFEASVTQQRTGQKSALAEDLKSVADAKHQTAGFGEALDLLHYGSEFGDGAGAQIITIREAAGDDDGVAVLQLMGLVP